MLKKKVVVFGAKLQKVLENQQECVLRAKIQYFKTNNTNEEFCGNMLQIILKNVIEKQ